MVQVNACDPAEHRIWEVQSEMSINKKGAGTLSNGKNLPNAKQLAAGEERTVERRVTRDEAIAFLREKSIPASLGVDHCPNIGGDTGSSDWIRAEDLVSWG